MKNKEYCKTCQLCKEPKIIKQVDPNNPKKTIDVALNPDRSCASKEATNSRDFAQCKNHSDLSDKKKVK